MKPRLSQRFQFSLVYVLVAAIVLSLLQSWLLAPPSAAGDRLRHVLGTDQDLRVFTVTRIPGVDEQWLVTELEKQKVEFAGRIETTFWKDLLFGWVIPLAVMIGIWMFLMRRV